MTTAHRVINTTPGSTPPIGTRITGASVILLDEQRHEVGAAQTGGIYIGGRCLARGYRDRPDLTADRFVELPNSPGLWYRTGDLAQWVDGVLEFRGRTDREQLKIRGNRVEAGDIEAALVALDAVSAAAVGLVGEGSDAALAALVVADSPDIRPATFAPTWRRGCRRTSFRPAMYRLRACL